MARWAVLVLVFTIPWENIVEIGGTGRISKVVGIGAATVWLVTVLVTGRMRKPGPVHLVVAMFAGWNVASLLWTSDVSTTLGQSFTYAQLAALVYVLWDAIRTHDALRAAMQAYVLGSCVTVVSLFADYLTGGTGYGVRFSTGSFEVNSLGFVLGAAIPFAWYLAVGPSSRPARKFLTILNLTYIPVAVVAVMLTGSRSAVASLVPGLVYVGVWLVRLGMSRGLLAVIVLAAVGFFLASQALVPERTLERLSTTGSAITAGDFGGRLETWRAAYDTFREHPIGGIGSGTFETLGTEKAAHNVALRFLAEIGLVGLGLFVAIVALTASGVRGQTRALAGLWISLLLVWGVGAAVHNFEDRKQTWLIFGLAAVSAALPVARTAPSRRDEVVIRAPISLPSV